MHELASVSVHYYTVRENNEMSKRRQHVLCSDCLSMLLLIRAQMKYVLLPTSGSAGTDEFCSCPVLFCGGVCCSIPRGCCSVSRSRGSAGASAEPTTISLRVSIHLWYHSAFSRHTGGRLAYIPSGPIVDTSCKDLLATGCRSCTWQPCIIRYHHEYPSRHQQIIHSRGAELLHVPKRRS